MAMKIGGEYLSDRISPGHFETLATEAGLAKPLVKQRVPELATSVIKGLNMMEAKQPVAVDVAKIIRQRSEEAVSRFSK
jgi:serine/threonine-protein kinase HipA